MIDEFKKMVLDTYGVIVKSVFLSRGTHEVIAVVDGVLYEGIFSSAVLVAVTRTKTI